MRCPDVRRRNLPNKLEKLRPEVLDALFFTHSWRSLNTIKSSNTLKIEVKGHWHLYLSWCEFSYTNILKWLNQTIYSVYLPFWMHFFSGENLQQDPGSTSINPIQLKWGVQCVGFQPPKSQHHWTNKQGVWYLRKRTRKKHLNVPQCTHHSAQWCNR